MNKNIKVAKQLVKLAKSLVDDNVDQISSWNDRNALELTKGSIQMLYNYLYVHLHGENRNPWKDREITNSRNEIRDYINKAESPQVKKAINEVLNAFMNVKNEKLSLQNAINRLKNIYPKITKLLEKYK